MNIITLVGPPGSGKGTYGRRLYKNLCSDNYDCKYICASSLIEQRLREDSGIFDNKYTIEDYNNGKFCPDYIVNKIIDTTLYALYTQGSLGPKYVVLDGYPRREEQFLYYTYFCDNNALRTTAIWIDECRDVLEHRIKNRVICETCGEIYSLSNSVLVPGDACAICNGNIVKRELDSDVAFLRRLAIYNMETIPNNRRILNYAN